MNYELVAPPYGKTIEKTLRRIKTTEGAETIRDGPYTYVVLALGTRPSAGYKLEIEEVKRTANEIIVSYSERKPDGMTASVISYPAAVIRLPATTLPVRVKKRR